MPSRIPEPMSTENLLEYRWRERLPVLAVKPDVTIPIKGRDLPTYVFPEFPPAPLNIRMGRKKGHVFAASPRPGLPPIKSDVWGYAIGDDPITYPGPVLVATENKPASITWKNELPETFPFVHPMPDLAAPGSVMTGRYSVGHAVVHMHGARVRQGGDGYPIRNVQQGLRKTILRRGEETTYEYPNEQPGGATLWFHDHAMDMTARNVYAGLAGGYLLRHKKEGSLKNLPCLGGKYAQDEIPLIIQDRSFTSDGELLYGDAGYLSGRIEAAQRHDRTASRTLAPPSPEFKGQALCVNGKLWPVLKVEPCPYRFRVYNGANSRMFVLRLSSQQGVDADLQGDPAAPIYQIGSDGGIFKQSVALSGKLDEAARATTTDFLVLAPGERADIIVDFSTVAGKSIFLTNHATNNSPLGNGGDDVANQPGLAHVLKFVVSGRNPQTLDRAGLDADLAQMQPQDQPAPLKQAPLRYVIEEFSVPYTANNNSQQWKAITIRAVGQDEAYPQAHRPGMLWGGTMPDVDPAQPPNTLQPSGMPNGGPAAGISHKTGETEIWEIYNISPDVHPIHLHLVNFRVLGREPITVDTSNNIVPAVPSLLKSSKVDPNEKLGWKDTVRANPDEKITLQVNFGGPNAQEYIGNFVWHCHLIEHEDMGMMRPLKVIA